MFNFLKNWKFTNTRQSTKPQQGAFEPIIGQTGLCVYLFYLYLFPSQINTIFPKKQLDCPLKYVEFYLRGLVCP